MKIGQRWPESGMQSCGSYFGHVPKYLGLILVRRQNDQTDLAADAQNGKSAGLQPNQYPEAGDDFYTVGVAARTLQTSPYQPGTPFQIFAQLLDRFDVIDMHFKGPVITAKVKYRLEPDFKNNEELKAYSIAIIDCIKELVTLNPLFKEALSLLLERINANEPGTLADLSATMTTASGAELQNILEIRPIRARIEQSFNVTRAYLDWLTILPWGGYTDDNYDIRKAENILNREHYGLSDVKDRILELISVGIIKGDLAGSIILLVGRRDFLDHYLDVRFDLSKVLFICTAN